MDAQFQLREDLLAVAGDLDLNCAEQFRDALTQLLERAAHPQVDVSAVESCDLSGLQLLRAAVVSGAAQGTPVTVTGGGSVVDGACRRLGSSLEALLQGGH
jgi:ABC-type transporter Mla MlaB component